MTHQSESGDFCRHQPANPSLSQTLQEIDFERGIWNAVINNDWKRMEVLFSRDPDIANLPDSHGYRPLHYAVRAGHLEMSKALIARGADVNSKLKSGDTALHRACYTGRQDIAELLIGHNAKACQGDGGQTPLHKAVQRGHLHLVPLLLQFYPELLKVGDDCGRLPTDPHYLKEAQRQSMEDLLSQFKTD